MKILQVGALLFHADKDRDRQTGRDMKRLIVAFRNFTNGAKTHSVNTDIISVVSSMQRESQTFGVSNGLRCAWPTLSCTTASLSVSLTYTRRCGKQDG
jgi:hypothetical protein